MFFRFPPDVRWNLERSVIEFGIGVGEYDGVVRVSRRVFQVLLHEAIGLYEAMGFPPRGPFGPYAAMPSRNIEASVFFEKVLCTSAD